MITQETLDQVLAQVAAGGLGATTLANLRRSWPEIHFTLCGEDDIPARLTPAAQDGQCGIYLVSNAEHCIAFTDHLEQASGLVLAAAGED